MGDMGDDFRIMNEMREEMLDDRLDRFKEKVLPILKNKYDVKTEDGETRYIISETPVGSFTIYPKANNLQLHADGTWHKPAVKWLHKNKLI